mmetsp:Transcript_1791/g.5864  ORF Transcript_1791/g.5864 Transcript_1791/m.5864 type:complete len:284 (-) Transcript_1791:124-975(-)
MLVLLPPSLGGHPFSVPHRGDPLAPLAQRAARVLGDAVVHRRGPPRRRALVAQLVAKEEELPRLGHHLEADAREEGVAASVSRLAVDEPGGDPLPLAPRPAVALSVAVGAVLVAVVLVVDSVNRLLARALHQRLVPGRLSRKGKQTPRERCDGPVRVIVLRVHVDRVRAARGGEAAARDHRAAHPRNGRIHHCLALGPRDKPVDHVDWRFFTQHPHTVLDGGRRRAARRARGRRAIDGRGAALERVPSLRGCHVVGRRLEHHAVPTPVSSLAGGIGEALAPRV